jgi:hypothetical protein
MKTNKDQLKNLLKPIIKECVKELILEQGVLSSMISEINSAKVQPSKVVENKEEVNKVTLARKETKLTEAKNKLVSAMGSEVYSNIFENLEPLTSYEAGHTKTDLANPLSGQAPNDPGVDISSIPGMGMWKTLVTDNKR